ncbi:aea478e8-9389-4828-895f-a6817ff97491 [Thermothielavioides terrestris]|uniref:Aea478e8-9389-4828-895f-a6817ff97491 n=1 Tax=Thermothielavioides terrestris TaxID=2587410 RepID=A0A446BN81_9PEZI|nr:aea478e8-9389-4828-895f-a6817ff97491 [Thermothielavioides terrestris]
MGEPPIEGPKSDSIGENKKRRKSK